MREKQHQKKIRVEYQYIKPENPEEYLDDVFDMIFREVLEEPNANTKRTS